MWLGFSWGGWLHTFYRIWACVFLDQRARSLKFIDEPFSIIWFLQLVEFLVIHHIGGFYHYSYQHFRKTLQYGDRIGWCCFDSFQVCLSIRYTYTSKYIVCRLPISRKKSYLKSRTTRLSFRGFTSKFTIGLWAIVGGFLLMFVNANFLTMLTMPIFEKPIETAEELSEKGFSIYLNPF